VASWCDSAGEVAEPDRLGGASVSRATVSDIASAAGEQANGIDEMSQTVAHMDEMTQAECRAGRGERCLGGVARRPDSQPGSARRSLPHRGWRDALDQRAGAPAQPRRGRDVGNPLGSARRGAEGTTCPRGSDARPQGRERRRARPRVGGVLSSLGRASEPLRHPGQAAKPRSSGIHRKAPEVYDGSRAELRSPRMTAWFRANPRRVQTPPVTPCRRLDLLGHEEIRHQRHRRVDPVRT
jgi:hypothetical protein